MDKDVPRTGKALTALATATTLREMADAIEAGDIVFGAVTLGGEFMSGEGRVSASFFFGHDEHWLELTGAVTSLSFDLNMKSYEQKEEV